MDAPDGRQDGRWLELAEAAEVLGVASAEALRKRLRRPGFDLPTRRANDGRWQVFVTADTAGSPDGRQAVSGGTGRDGRADVEWLSIQFLLTAAGTSGRVAALEAEAAALRGHVGDLRAERDRLLAELTALRERRRWPGLWPAVRRFLYGAD
jgi:hypothetical protein